jgi:hypothetical protein
MRTFLAKMSEEVFLHLASAWKEKHERNVSSELIIYLPTELTTVEFL